MEVPWESFLEKARNSLYNDNDLDAADMFLLRATEDNINDTRVQELWIMAQRCEVQYWRTSFDFSQEQVDR